MFITHDMGVIAEIADRVMVMYGGPHCRARHASAICFCDPRHPYTRALLDSIPPLEGERPQAPAIDSGLAALAARPICPAVAFAPRCPKRFEKCAATA